MRDHSLSAETRVLQLDETQPITKEIDEHLHLNRFVGDVSISELAFKALYISSV